MPTPYDSVHPRALRLLEEAAVLLADVDDKHLRDYLSRLLGRVRKLVAEDAAPAGHPAPWDAIEAAVVRLDEPPAGDAAEGRQ